MGERQAMDAREGGVGAALDAVDLRDRQAGRIDAIDAARRQQIALLQVRICSHEAQLEPATMRIGIAERHAPCAGAGVLYGYRQVAIDHQRDFAREGLHLSDLAQHAVLVDDGRTGSNAMRHSLVDHDFAGVRIRCVIEHLCRARGRWRALSQFQQRPQPRVLLQQGVGLAGALGLDRQRLARIGLAALRRLQVFEVTTAADHRLHRFQREPLHRIQHGTDGRAQRLHEMEPCIGHHEE